MPAPPASSATVTIGQRAQGNVLVNVHAKSRLTPDHCGHSGQKPRARPEPARTGRGPSPARCGRSPDSSAGPATRRQATSPRRGPGRCHFRQAAAGGTDLRPQRDGRRVSKPGEKGDEQTPTPGVTPGLAAPAAPIGEEGVGGLDCSAASRPRGQGSAPFRRAVVCRSVGQRRELTITPGQPINRLTCAQPGDTVTVSPSARCVTD